MRDHRKLRAFKLADELAVEVYKLSSELPKSEQFGLTSQMRRAAISVPANIVEGCARRTTRDFKHFLEIAMGSLREVGYLLDISCRLFSS